MPFVLTLKKKTSVYGCICSLRSADVVAAVEGVDVVRNEKFLRRELDSNFRLFSQPPSIENFVVDRKASAWARHNGSVNSKRAHPPGHLLGISIKLNSVLFTLL